MKSVIHWYIRLFNKELLACILELKVKLGIPKQTNYDKCHLDSWQSALILAFKRLLRMPGKV